MRAWDAISHALLSCIIHYMKHEIVYFADVSKIEDNIAHLLEHCITAQVHNRLMQNNLDLFECYSTTTPNNIIFQIAVYNNLILNEVSEIMGSLKLIDLDALKTEMHRIELEDDLPLFTDNVKVVLDTINQLITNIKFKTTDSVDNIPQDEVDDGKPDDQLLVYGLGVKEWMLKIDTNGLDETTMQLMDCLIGRFLRCRLIYAVEQSDIDDKRVYKFRTDKETEQNALSDRWHKVCSSFLDSSLERIVDTIYAANEPRLANNAIIGELKRSASKATFCRV